MKPGQAAGIAVDTLAALDTAAPETPMDIEVTFSRKDIAENTGDSR